MDPYAQMQQRLSAAERRLNAVYRIGRVHSVTVDPYRVRVDLGPDETGARVVTGPLPVLVPRAGVVRVWSPLGEGEAVGVLSPGGEDRVAHVLPALIADDWPAPHGDDDEEVVAWRSLDGSTEVGRLRVSRGVSSAASTAVLTIGAASITITGGGDITLEAPGTIYLRTPSVQGITR